MARNYNIQTDSVHLDDDAANDAIGPVVPAGMTRYVTFIRVNSMRPDNSGGSRVFFCSAGLNLATTNALASAAQKMVVQLASLASARKSVMIPPGGPDTEHPLFTVASAAYLRVHLQSAALTATSSVQLFVQFYDE